MSNFNYYTSDNTGGQPWNGLPSGGQFQTWQPRQYGHTITLDEITRIYAEFNPKEKVMSTKSAEIAAVRAKERETRIAELIEKYEAFIRDDIGDAPGSFFQARAKFPDNDTVYYYAFIYGSNKRWYQTNSIGGKTTAELVDLLVATTLDAETFEVD